MKLLSIALLCAILCVSYSPEAQAAAERKHAWWKAAFSAPETFSEPQKAGMDAVTLIQPDTAAPGSGRIEITLVAIPKDMREGMGMKSDDELAGYVKSTFLGTTKPAEKTVERTFLGKKVAGGVQNVKIPRKAELTLFLIPLSGQDTLALALVRDASVPADEAESVLATISRTIAEIPEKKSE
jgi:hypothetical protein